jgi:hypothetical protein
LREVAKPRVGQRRKVVAHLLGKANIENISQTNRNLISRLITMAMPMALSANTEGMRKKL